MSKHQKIVVVIAGILCILIGWYMFAQNVLIGYVFGIPLLAIIFFLGAALFAELTAVNKRERIFNEFSNIDKEELEPFPSPMHIRNFEMNFLWVELVQGFKNYTVVAFMEWTKEPGVGKFKVSDPNIVTDLIPTCALSEELVKTLPEQDLTESVLN